MTPSFLPHVLSLEPSECSPFLRILNEAVATALSCDELQTRLLGCLETYVSGRVYPAWLLLHAAEDHRDALSSIVHLDTPLFWAESVDGDSFFSRFHGLEKGQLIYRRYNSETFEYTGSRNPKERKRRMQKDIERVGAYDLDGGCVLTQFRWFGQRPDTTKALVAFLETASLASREELPLYTAPSEEEVSATPSIGESLPSAPSNKKEKKTTKQEKKTAESDTSGVQETRSETVYCFGADQGRSNAYSEEGPRQTPRILWYNESDGVNGSEWGGDPVVGDGFVFASTSSYTLQAAVVGLDGRTHWARQITSSQGWPVGGACIVGGVIYMGSNKGIHALDVGTGEERWLSKISGIEQSAPVVVDGVCYALGKGALSAIRCDTGRKIWSFDCEGKYWKGLAYKEGVLFFSVDGLLYALEASKQKRIVWKAPCSAFMLGGRGPLVYGEQVIVNAPQYESLQALDRATGRRLWEVRFAQEEGCSVGGGALAAAEDVLVGLDGKGRLQALNLADGSPRWCYVPKDFSKPYKIGNRGATIAGRTVYVVMVEDGGMGRQELVAVDLFDGSELWRLGKMPYVVDGQPYKDQAFSWHCTPAVAQGVVYAQICNQLFALGS